MKGVCFVDFDKSAILYINIS